VLFGFPFLSQLLKQLRTEDCFVKGLPKRTKPTNGSWWILRPDLQQRATEEGKTTNGSWWVVRPGLVSQITLKVL
jgi:hypothetical protein